MVKPRPAQPTVKFIDDYCENYRGFAAKSLLVGLGVGRRSSVVGRFKLCCPLSLYQCMYCKKDFKKVLPLFSKPYRDLFPEVRTYKKENFTSDCEQGKRILTILDKMNFM
ncbi:MAG: hypothetical protein EWV89_08790 [Microcystis wesenbergii Mw_QC_B_20070930_S4]|nr:MAG: hypothetical protein EWV89_08790 [Microcystis wesenbergii Mw_QC_B_20070930_S4]